MDSFALGGSFEKAVNSADTTAASDQHKAGQSPSLSSPMRQNAINMFSICVKLKGINAKAGVR